jgi:hypothetical protein
MSEPFLKLMKNKETMELLTNAPNAFTLLYQIAIRAKRTTGLSVNGLAIGQAVIGDYKTINLTEQKYRTAKSQLEKWGFATFEATNKGTVANLINSRVFDINEEDRQRPSNGQTTTKTTGKATNKKDAENIENSDNYATEETASNGQGNGQGNSNVTTNKNKEVKNTHMRRCACPYEPIIGLFNSMLPALPHVDLFTDERKRTIRARWMTSDKTQSLDWWKEFFSHVGQSDFLMGRAKDDFRASFDWIIKKSNFVKIIEGNYHK